MLIASLPTAAPDQLVPSFLSQSVRFPLFHPLPDIRVPPSPTPKPLAPMRLQAVHEFLCIAMEEPGGAGQRRAGSITGAKPDSRRAIRRNRSLNRSKHTFPP